MIFSLPINFDPRGQASILAAQGKRALGHGNIQEARKLFAESGKLLETEARSKTKHRDKVLIWFLAATQYYLGGHYSKAEELCRRIENKFLPERVQEIYRKFRIDVLDRAKPDYVRRIRDRMLYHRRRNEYQQVLDILKDHQYVHEEWDLAYIRGSCCVRMGDYETAAIFFSDVVKHFSDNAELVHHSTTWALPLLADHRVADAWALSQHLLKYAPHALTFLTASLVRFVQATQENQEMQLHQLYQEQLDLFDEAENRFATIPLSAQRSEDYRELMTLGFDYAALAYRNVGKIDAAQKVLNRAIAFDPKSPSFWSLRGSFTFPDPNAIEDFRKAIDLGEKGFLPHVYLAADAMNRRDFSGAVEWMRKALLRDPNAITEAWLRQSLTIAASRLAEAKNGDERQPFLEPVLPPPIDLNSYICSRSKLEEIAKSLAV